MQRYLLLSLQTVSPSLIVCIIYDTLIGRYCQLTIENGEPTVYEQSIEPRDAEPELSFLKMKFNSSAHRGYGYELNKFIETIQNLTNCYAYEN